MDPGDPNSGLYAHGTTTLLFEPSPSPVPEASSETWQDGAKSKALVSLGIGGDGVFAIHFIPESHGRCPIPHCSPQPI